MNVKLKWSRYRPDVAQRVGRGIALLFHDRGTRRGWVVSRTPRPHFTPGKDPVPILQENGWAPGPVWMGGKSRPHRDSIPDRPARSQSLYRLSYPAHEVWMYWIKTKMQLVADWDHSSIADWRTKIPAIFHMILGILCHIWTFLCIYCVISRGTFNNVLWNPGCKTLV